MASEADLPVVGLCQPGEVLALRQSVLRPHQTLEELRYKGDLSPGVAHFCAKDSEGRVVSIGSVWPEAPPWQPGASPAWRLRGMATAPEWRGKGIGAALLSAALAYVHERGGGLFWCNARLSAVAFYERGGLHKVGEPWEEPVIGAHVAMCTTIRA